MKIVFIGGTGRCGTNLTKAILAKRSKVYAMPFEWRFLTDPDGIIDFYTSLSQIWSPYLADRKLKRLDGLFRALIYGDSDRYKGWSIDDILPEILERWENTLDELVEFIFAGKWYGQPANDGELMIYMPPEHKDEFTDIFRRFLQDTMEVTLAKNNADIFIEDGTWNVLFLPQIYELLPEAKVIHVIRNPLDTVLDMSQQTWCPSDLVQCARWYKGIMGQARKSHRAVIDKAAGDLKKYPHYINLKFEYLVTEPEAAVKALCRFAAIDYESVMIDMEFKTDQIGVWEKAKEENQAVRQAAPIVEKMLQGEMEELGYR